MKRLTRLLYGALLIAAFLFSPTSEQTVDGIDVLETPRIGLARDASLPHAQDHILVKMTRRTARRLGEKEQIEPIFQDWHRVAVKEDETPTQAMKRWSRKAGVTLVELDYLVEAAGRMRRGSGSGFIPNDPLYEQQWNLTMIQAPTAWERSIGAGVVVAALDSGVSRGDDLACREFVAPYNALTRQEGENAAADDFGHGTHVAGTIAQCTNNALGAAGLAFGVSLMPIKVLDAQGVGTYSNVAAGVEWARTHAADVINLSLGGRAASSILVDAIRAAAADDIVLVAAAGNNAEGKEAVFFPANMAEVMAVAAVDYQGERAPYSNRGSKLSLSAPGGYLDADDDAAPYLHGILQQTVVNGQWGYELREGTSMAAAHVAAAAALLRARAPNATREQIQIALETTSLDLGAPGFDAEFGAGLLQVNAALTAIESGTPTPTATRIVSETPTLTPTPTPLSPSLWLPLHLYHRAFATPTPTPTPKPPEQWRFSGLVVRSDGSPVIGYSYIQVWGSSQPAAREELLQNLVSDIDGSYLWVEEERQPYPYYHLYLLPIFPWYRFTFIDALPGPGGERMNERWIRYARRNDNSYEGGVFVIEIFPP
ncbi:MAG: S8 family serine peptidase [Chloroflexi bacterium]|nr:S8 family serine peptidase [Chloroflexota bacterium]